jgi:hypothetical protein
MQARQPTFQQSGCTNLLSALLDMAEPGGGVHMLAQDMAVILEHCFDGRSWP